jgi:hypothetical protein
MRLVKKPHGGDEDYAATVAPLGFAPMLHRFDALNDLHMQNHDWSDGITEGWDMQGDPPLLQSSSTPIPHF